MGKKKLNKNPAALIALILIIISGFTLPIFSISFFGESFSDKGDVMFNLYLNLFSGKYSITHNYEYAIIGLVIIFPLILLFYLFSGLGIVYYRHARYASFLTVVFLLIGLIAVLFINRENKLPFFGNMLGALSIGPGIYFVAIVGVLYLIFAKSINRKIRF